MTPKEYMSTFSVHGRPSSTSGAAQENVPTCAKSELCESVYLENRIFIFS